MGWNFAMAANEWEKLLLARWRRVSVKTETRRALFWPSRSSSETSLRKAWISSWGIFSLMEVTTFTARIEAGSRSVKGHILVQNEKKRLNSINLPVPSVLARVYL